MNRIFDVYLGILNDSNAAVTLSTIAIFYFFVWTLRALFYFSVIRSNHFTIFRYEALLDFFNAFKGDIFALQRGLVWNFDEPLRELINPYLTDLNFIKTV